MNYIINTLTDCLFCSIVSILLVFLLVYYATLILSKEFSIIWDKLKLSPWIKWATFDAIWWSIPEFFTAIVSIIILGKKWLEIWIWTIWWSAIFNILMISFFAIVFYKKNKIKKFSKYDIKRDTIFFIISILILFFWINNNLYFLTSIFLIITYLVYLYFLRKQNNIYISMHKHRIKKHYKNVKNIKVNFLKILLAFVILYFWVELSIHSVVYLSNYYWISHFVTSLILLAIITSSPDLLLWIRTSREGRIDSSFWNAVWSNIFNICIWLGIPILIGLLLGINFNNSFFIDYHILIFLILSSLIFLYLGFKKKILKKDWYILLLTYIIFILYVFLS